MKACLEVQDPLSTITFVVFFKKVHLMLPKTSLRLLGPEEIN